MEDKINSYKDFKMIFLSFLIGILVGTISSFFRLFLSHIEIFREMFYENLKNHGFIGWGIGVFIGFIVVAIALYLLKKFAPEASGSGVHEIEGALEGLRPTNWKRVIPVKFIASLFSLGSGMLLGREGPTIQIGANIGKMVKDIFKESDKNNNPLLSAGAAAGLASAFNAPLSGIIFVIEEMHDHFKYSFISVGVIMIASGTADFMTRVIVGVDPVIKMIIFKGSYLSSLWLFIIIGIFFSIIGFIFNRMLMVSLDFFKNRLKSSIITISLISGIIIVLTGMFYPSMIGGGYRTIRLILDHDFTFSFLIILFLGRFFLTLFSYGTGVPGGIFAPLIAIGVIFGMMFGVIIQNIFPGLITHPGIFAVAGMAGIFASTVRAPITGLVLAVEMTSNFELILPLIITTATASLISELIGNKPIYSTLLERTLKIHYNVNIK